MNADAAQPRCEACWRINRRPIDEALCRTCVAAMSKGYTLEEVTKISVGDESERSRFYQIAAHGRTLE